MKVKDIIDFGLKTKIQAGMANTTGKYVFFTSSEDESKRYDEYCFDDENIIMGTGGNATLHYYNGKCAVSTDCLVLKAKKNIETKYLYYFFKQNMKILQDGFKGAGLKHTNKEYIGNISINTLPDVKIQKEIVYKIDTISNIINLYQSQLKKLDLLVKSRFVEMFGDLKTTKYDIKTLEEITEFIKDGTHNTPTYTEDKRNGFKFLSSKDVTSGKIDWSNIKYIPKELHEYLYARITPKRNDILLAKNGTTGICAVVDTDEVFDIYVSLALLRFKKGINPVYMWAVINSPMSKEQFDSHLKGVGVPNLHLGEIKKTRVIVPPIEIQENFASFVAQVDKSKFVEKIWFIW